MECTLGGHARDQGMQRGCCLSWGSIKVFLLLPGLSFPVWDILRGLTDSKLQWPVILYLGVWAVLQNWVVQFCSCQCSLRMPAHGVCCQLPTFLHADRRAGHTHAGWGPREAPSQDCASSVTDNCAGFCSWSACRVYLGSSSTPLVLVSRFLFGRMCYSSLRAVPFSLFSLNLTPNLWI